MSGVLTSTVQGVHSAAVAKGAGAAVAKTGLITALSHGIGIGTGIGLGLGIAIWGPILTLGGLGLIVAIAQRRRLDLDRIPTIRVTPKR